MSLPDELHLSPLEKWRKYRIFPVKMLLHLLLVILVTSKVIIFTYTDSTYTRSMQRSWRYFFFPKTASFTSDNAQLYTVNYTIAHFYQTLNTFHTLNNISTTDFTYRQGDSYDCTSRDSSKVIHAHTTHYHHDQLHEYTTLIRTIDDFAFIVNDTDAYFSSLRSLELKMFLCNTHITQAVTTSQHRCYRWNVNVFYQFISQLYISIEVRDYLAGACSEKYSFTSYLKNHLNIIELIISMLTIAFIVLIVKGILRSWHVVKEIKTAHALAQKYPGSRSHVSASLDWEKIPTGVKLQLHQLWLYPTLVGALLLLGNSAYRIVHGHEYVATVTADKLTLGVSCLILWASLMHYFKRLPNIYALTMTLVRVASRILAYVAGLVPMYFGATFLAIALFNKKLSIFGSFLAAAKTEFTLMNGDVVLPMLNKITGSYPAGSIFVIVFMCLSIYLGVNIFIAIVEEAYFQSRKKRRYLDNLLANDLVGTAVESDAASAVSSSTTTGPLCITAEEERAEKFLFGEAHWEYNKVLDYLAARGREFSSWIPDRK